MILVDTSVWVDHLRKGDVFLTELLDAEHVQVHPFVLGEIAMGRLANRPAALQTLRKLLTCSVAADDRVMNFVEHERRFSTGIGYIDAHLLVSASLTPNLLLWTRDKRLLQVASRLSVGFVPLQSS